MTLDEAKYEILSHLDIAAELAAHGLRFSSNKPRSNGWQPCHAIGRDDNDPSAAVCTAGSNGELGRYVDKGSGDKGGGRSLSFWDLMVELGAFPNWKAVFDYYAEKRGIVSSAKRKPKDKSKFTVGQQINLQCAENSKSAIRQWAQAKPPITEAAIVAAQGRCAVWPRDAPDHARKSVIAIPAYRPGMLDKPAEAVLYMPDGSKFPAAKDYGLEERKVHIVRDRSMARGDCLIVVGGWPALAAAEAIWLTEGPTDCLALAGVLPPGQIAISSTHGAAEFGDELATVTSGKKVRIVGDADTAGVSGAKLRASKVVCLAAETRIISLPYPIEPKHGLDLRDYLAGHTFEDLAKLVDSAPVLAPADFPAAPLRRSVEAAGQFGNRLRNEAGANGHQYATTLAAAEPQASGGNPFDARPNGGQGSTGEGDEEERPHVTVSLNEFKTNEKAAQALGADVQVYQRGGVLVHIVGDEGVEKKIRRPAGLPRIVPLPEALVRDRMTAAMVFMVKKRTEDGEITCEQVRPPKWCIKAVHQRGQWSSVRRLTGVVNCPTLRPDGSILATPGYDEATGLYLYIGANEFPAVPEHPTQADITTAVESLQEVVCDFPFKAPEHKSGWMALVLTLLARYAFDGTAPLFLFDGNIAGSGKGMLASAAAIIATGFTMPATAFPDEDVEMRKVVTSLALNGDSLVMLDNINRDLGGAALDAALTATRWKDRILGGNQIYDGPLDLTWCATGNNLTIVGDTARRVLPVRLESPLEKPEERTDFRHKDLLAWVQTERLRLITAGLTLLRGYFAAGRPDMGLSAWGSFNEWSALIRNTLVWAQLPDPAKARKEFAIHSDRPAAALRAMITALDAIAPKPPGYTAAELLALAKGTEPHALVLRNAILEFCPAKGNDLPSSKSLGKKLAGVRARVKDGKSISSEPKSGGTLTWFVHSPEDSTEF